MKRIYFCGSIRGGQDLVETYARIINLLQKHGKVLTEHIADPNILEKEEQLQTDNDIYEQDISWLKESDIVIAEVTVPSIGVGYEVGYAVRMKKPILCLYKEGADHKISAMISGCPDVEIVHYKSFDKLKAPIEDFINKN